MKNFGKILLGLAVLAAIVSSARANSVYVTHFAGYWFGGGGEFSLNFTAPLDPAIELSAYAPQAIIAVPGDGTYYQSFCLELGESVPLNNTYSYVVNDRAINGGVGPAGDPISIGTAFLFSQFAAGTLAGYDYTATSYGVDRSASAAYLQQAIWWLENEETLSASQQAANSFIVLVQGMWTNPMADNNGTYRVAALNLYDAAGNLAQDQLVLVPDGGLTVALLGMAFIGLLALKRRFLA